jgi:hypothetical protein
MTRTRSHRWHGHEATDDTDTRPQMAQMHR